jgi:dTDP-4-amino-4,6-dideoxygalactose transaminase
MDAIMKIAEEYELVVIEDSAETIGAKLNGKKAGSFGIGCFSFYPTKNITTGEGGMITTNDDILLKKIKTIKAHGIEETNPQKKERKWYRESILPGYNMRMSDINAAIGIEQLKKVEEMNSLRRKNSQYMVKSLKSVKEIEVPEVDDINKHVYQMFVIKVKDDSKRDPLLEYLWQKEIGASVHFEPPVHLQKYYKDKYATKLPITEKICKQVITLPMFPQLKKEEMDYIVVAIREFFERP